MKKRSIFKYSFITWVGTVLLFFITGFLTRESKHTFVENIPPFLLLFYLTVGILSFLTMILNGVIKVKSKIKPALIVIIIFLSGIVIGFYFKRPIVSSFAIRQLDNPQAVLADINEFRATKNYSPLVWNEKLCVLASERVTGIQSDWSHAGFTNRGQSRYADFCPSCHGMGENLARGFVMKKI